MTTHYGKKGLSELITCGLPGGTGLQNGKYIIIEVYGQGPFSLTYLARQTILGKQVIVNEMFLHDFDSHQPDNIVLHKGISEEVYRKFRQKWFEVARQLSGCSRNENFVTVLDAFEENDTVYYVTDYAGEEDLRSYTLGQRDKCLDEVHAISFITQVVSGLSFLHENNICHLNLSPVKILLGKGHKLIIFSVGIARNDIPEEITPDITILARNGYTAPELYTRESERGILADIYSTGAVLYFLLTGKNPVPANERHSRPLTEPRRLNPKISQATNSAVMKAMSMDPAARQQSLDDFMLDLRKTRSSPVKKMAKSTGIYVMAIIALAVIVYGGIKYFGRNENPFRINNLPVSAGTRQDQIARLTLQQDNPRGITMLSDAVVKDTVVIGKNYALFIGIEKYKDQRYHRLSQPVNDAMALSEVLTGVYTFNKEDVKFLRDPEKKDIFQALNYFRDSITPNDNLFVFYAGHGRYDKKADMGYIIPVNGDYQNDADWISFQEIREKFNIIPAKHILLIADACFAGSVFRGEDTTMESRDKIVFDQISRRSRTAFTSAYLKPVPDRSEFLRHLISTLKNNRDKCMLSEDLYINTRNSLIKSTSDTDPVKYGIIRDCGDEGGDFIFIRRKQ